MKKSLNFRINANQANAAAQKTAQLISNVLVQENDNDSRRTAPRHRDNS